MATFYAQVGGKTIGPLDGDKLKRLAAGGKISREDKISKDGKSGWVAASSVTGLFPATEPSLSPLAPSVSGTNLRPCPDCGELVSIRAAACPRCGCPVQVSANAVHSNPVPVNQDPIRRKWRARFFAGTAVLVVLLVGTMMYRYWAFASAMTKAEQADPLHPDRAALEQARQWAWLDPEKARVRKLENKIAVAAPVAKFVEAYNKKNINEMLAQWDHQRKIEMATLAIKILRAAIPIPSILGVEDLKQLWLGKDSDKPPDEKDSDKPLDKEQSGIPLLDKIIRLLAEHQYSTQLENDRTSTLELTGDGAASMTVTMGHRIAGPGIGGLERLELLTNPSHHTVKLTLNKTKSGWLIYWAELLNE